jgi:hypothetical protein
VKRLRRKPCLNLSPIYFLIDGRPKVYRCDCGAREFQIGTNENGTTELVCLFRKRHRVMTGFYVGEPEVEREIVWLGKALRGVQLPLKFPQWMQIGKPKKFRSRWTSGA